MENIILVTILLTLLGAGLVVLLVWLSISSWKSIKYIKKSREEFKNLNSKLVQEIEQIYKYIEESKSETDMHFKSIESSIDSRFDKLYNLSKERVDKK